MNAEEHWAKIRVEITKKLLMKDKAKDWFEQRRKFLQEELSFLEKLEKEVQRL